MMLIEVVWFSLLIVFATMYLGDALNGVTAAVRELIEIMRKDRP